MVVIPLLGSVGTPREPTVIVIVLDGVATVAHPDTETNIWQLICAPLVSELVVYVVPSAIWLPFRYQLNI